MTYLLFVGVLLVIGRIVFVYAAPERDCRWCGGTGRWWLGRRCWRCGGDGHTWRFGARLVRKAHLAVVRAWQERGEEHRK